MHRHHVSIEQLYFKKVYSVILQAINADNGNINKGKRKQLIITVNNATIYLYIVFLEHCLFKE
ncbi:hypothetical protein BD560DRAFT_395924 [Blakeslea trispora]|nr:hypothetical protein BD560DRAFT_395924 [Blakeslea trispora]